MTLNAGRLSRRRLLDSMSASLLAIAGAGSVLSSSKQGAAQPSKADVLKLLGTIDDRQRNTGDFRSTVFIEQKQKDKADVVYQATVYRRGRDQKFMMLFDKPKASQGQGYLRIDKNLWFYDPSIGRWERRTERERIAGTNSRRSDLDESRLAEEYEPSYLGEDKLGAYLAIKLKLQAKPGVDSAFPVIELWVDKDSNNVLERRELALSGKLIRTSYYPKWKKAFSESKHADVWYPEELRQFDEIEKANQTLIVTKEVDLRPLEDSLFTKAWLEAKSR
ncbi:MAG TPA: outer membrane lipoprotein-sorting protein [Polyangiaceae bacterium]|nr:outer membrane lipoprotein-sorting protein [Polyangiaceae bacterium]